MRNRFACSYHVPLRRSGSAFPFAVGRSKVSIYVLSKQGDVELRPRVDYPCNILDVLIGKVRMRSAKTYLVRAVPLLKCIVGF